MTRKSDFFPNEDLSVLAVARTRVAEAVHEQYVADFSVYAAEDGCLEIVLGLNDGVLTQEDIEAARKELHIEAGG